MTGLITQAMARYAYGTWSMIGTILFMLVFLGCLAWVFRRGSGEFYDAMRMLPFEGSHPPAMKGESHE